MATSVVCVCVSLVLGSPKIGLHLQLLACEEIVPCQLELYTLLQFLFSHTSLLCYILTSSPSLSFSEHLPTPPSIPPLPPSLP